MTEAQAAEIAGLLNMQNQLAGRYTAQDVLKEQERFLVELTEDIHVAGAVEVKWVQWYQAEILHVSVHPDMKRQGIGRRLVSLAEDRAREQGARIAQCTIRDDNVESLGLFEKCGYLRTVQFRNAATGNTVVVLQKVL